MFKINPDHLIYLGVIGLSLGLFFSLYFIYKRIRFIIRKTGKKKTASPKLLKSIRNLVLIFLWIAVFGMVLFIGFFFRAYHVFTYEKPVAELFIRPADGPDKSFVILTQFLPDEGKVTKEFVIKGEQWMLEGDILKWKNWLNFLGLHTRYRLTRLRGRYIQTEDERTKEKTIYPLVENENRPLWRRLYKYGHRFPLVSAVYGNATFQAARKENHFLVYVSTSGFLVRTKE